MSGISIKIEDLFDLPGAEIFNPDAYKPVSAVSIDSRNIPSNAIFIAIAGEKLDGHDYLSDAINNGAKAVIINKKKYEKFLNQNIPLVTVEDTTKTLGDLARVWRKKLNTKIIGITGSAGKTSTKEMLAVILNEKFNVNKTIANNNNHIGVPLTIFSTNNRHDVLVAELGTNHFGEIEYTADILKPNYAVITNIGSSHLEFLKNKKGVLKEKLALFQAAAENDGMLFINYDDPFLKKAVENYPNKITYSFKSLADSTGEITDYSDEGKPVVEIKYKGKKLNEEFPLYGEQNAKNLLAAVTIAFKLGLTKAEISTGIKKLKAVDKRLNVKRGKDFLLIDDTYNANPESMKSALELLGRIKIFNKKIAVLGDMFELGESEKKLHEEIAPLIQRNKINLLLTIGKRMKILSGLLKNSNIKNKHFASRDALKKYLKKMDIKNSAILIKGSRGMKMEEFAAELELLNKN